MPSALWRTLDRSKLLGAHGQKPWFKRRNQKIELYGLSRAQGDVMM